ncbi:MAG: hypothetical protein WCD20_08935 [Rhodomicrobium sp.]
MPEDDSEKLFSGYWSETEYCEQRGITKRTARNERKERRGPPYARVGRQSIYPIEDAKRWLRSRLQSPIRASRPK